MKKEQNIKSISAAEFDEKFDFVANIMEHLDIDKAMMRVNVDFPL